MARFHTLVGTIGAALAASLLVACSDDGEPEPEAASTPAPSATSSGTESDLSAPQAWEKARQRLVAADTGTLGGSLNAENLPVQLNVDYQLSTEAWRTQYVTPGPRFTTLVRSEIAWLALEGHEGADTGRCWIKGASDVMSDLGVELDQIGELPAALRVLAAASGQSFVPDGRGEIRALAPVGLVVSSVGPDLVRAVGDLATSDALVPIGASVSGDFYSWSATIPDIAEVAREEGQSLPDFLTAANRRSNTSRISVGIGALGEDVDLTPPPAEVTYTLAEVGTATGPECVDD